METVFPRISLYLLYSEKFYYLVLFSTRCSIYFCNCSHLFLQDSRRRFDKAINVYDQVFECDAKKIFLVRFMLDWKELYPGKKNIYKSPEFL